jgi:hypothetical protein
MRGIALTPSDPLGSSAGPSREEQLTTSEFHAWLSTPDALAAARKPVGIPMRLLGGKARAVGADELESEALEILTDCARRPGDRTPTECARCGGSLDQVRAGAKFCSAHCRTTYAVWVQRGKAIAIPPRTPGYFGSMWRWPESEMTKYATCEVGYVLCNCVRTHLRVLETPASEYIATR